MNERRDKNTMEGGGGEEGERYSEQGRVIEQLRGEERAARSGERKRYGLANKRGARRGCKLFAL